MDLNARFLAVMQHYGLNKGDFAQKLGISQGVISHISSGRNKPGMEMTQSLLTEFPDISADWLVLGRGDMFRPKEVWDGKADLLKLLDEIKLLNQMNYNGLSARIESLADRIKG